jgi:formamidopyrimidine-DNA glycosylase
VPELPEVETIKNELSPRIIGKRIVDVTLLDPKAVKEPSPEGFRRELKGKTIENLNRRGKYLLFHLSQGKTLIIHLRMTGALLLNNPADRYVRAVFRLSGGDQLAFVDRRRLGILRLTDHEEAIISKLGPEPLARGFTVGKFAQRLRGRTAPIKAVLLDQHVVAGVGNMYADELLFRAKIHPLRRTDSLSQKEIKTIYLAMRSVLHAAIEGKGASVDTYKRPAGNSGTAHIEFAVAHRENEPCPVCGTPITRLPVRNRGSYYCPRCQRFKNDRL